MPSHFVCNMVVCNMLKDIHIYDIYVMFIYKYIYMHVSYVYMYIYKYIYSGYNNIYIYIYIYIYTRYLLGFIIAWLFYYIDLMNENNWYLINEILTQYIEWVTQTYTNLLIIFLLALFTKSISFSNETFYKMLVVEYLISDYLGNAGFVLKLIEKKTGNSKWKVMMFFQIAGNISLSICISSL